MKNITIENHRYNCFDIFITNEAGKKTLLATGENVKDGLKIRHTLPGINSDLGLCANEEALKVKMQAIVKVLIERLS